MHISEYGLKKMGRCVFQGDRYAPLLTNHWPNKEYGTPYMRINHLFFSILPLKTRIKLEIAKHFSHIKYGFVLINFLLNIRNIV